MANNGFRFYRPSPSVFIAYIDLGTVGWSEPNREMIPDLAQVGSLYICGATDAYLSLAPCPNLVVNTHTHVEHDHPGIHE